MVETAKPDVQIILSIKEGKGFEQVLQPTLLSGTLNGHSLETDRIEPSANPQYATDLIWETNKAALRKMRSGQAPLKLECFAFKENGCKEKIGYVVLSIRSAHITSKYRDLSPKANWYKLLGLRNDLKIQKPEILLTLRIEDWKNVDSNPIIEKCAEFESHRNPSGDYGKLNFNSISGIKSATECRNTNKQTSDCRCLKHQVTRDTCSCSCDAMLCKCINKNYTKDMGFYYCYCLHISLMTITSLSAKLSERQIEFRFHHPKAEITSTMRATMPLLSDEKIKLQDIGCQFHFISAPNEIKQLLQSFPPQISMYDINGDTGPLSLFMLDVKPLFHQDKPECQYKLPLYDADKNKIGEMDVTLKLENCGSHFVLKKETAKQNLGPPIMDDSLAYKIVDELETWKERQKEMFKAELKKKEERHLNMLNEEWRKQKENLESKLACSVEQCKMLASSLNNATEDLRTRRLKSLENETRLIKANEDLQWRYENKLQELKDSMLTMQNNLASKITKLEEKKIALEAQVEILLFENENLKSSMSQQKDELQIYQKGALAQDQTESMQQELKILEKKLENAQKGKTFFKEQWGKAVREIHRMKVDYQQEMQVQIKNSKEDLAEILSADTAALTEDQILLNELQKEIDVIKPRQSEETHDRVFEPADAYSKVSWNGDKMFDKSEEDERLQALREERDSLLRTGSYATDDIVIKKLNSEIRSLLVK